MSSLLLAFVTPLGGAVLAAAAVVGAEELGIPIGLNQVTGGVVAFLILREVFAFVRDRRGRNLQHDDSAERLEVQREIHEVLKQQTDILARMEESQAAILTITTQYQATGICPLTDPIKRQSTIRDMADEVARRRRGPGSD